MRATTLSTPRCFLRNFHYLLCADGWCEWWWESKYLNIMFAGDFYVALFFFVALMFRIPNWCCTWVAVGIFPSRSRRKKEKCFRLASEEEKLWGGTFEAQLRKCYEHEGKSMVEERAGNRWVDVERRKTLIQFSLALNFSEARLCLVWNLEKCLRPLN